VGLTGCRWRFSGADSTMSESSIPTLTTSPAATSRTGTPPFLLSQPYKTASCFHPSRVACSMCLPQPIDIVYTWVNGSDPLLLKNLAALKLQLEVCT
jgi:hypothetical protein